MRKEAKIALVIYTAIWLLVNKVRNVIRGLAIKYNGFRILSSVDGGNVSRVRLSLLLRNTIPLGITVNAISGTIYMQGVPAAAIDQQLDLYIESNSITPVDLDFDIDWTGVNSGIYANVMSGNVATLSFKFVGTITAEGRAFNVNKTIGYYDLV